MTNAAETVPTAISKGYEHKPQQYFAGARRDFVDEMPVAPDARILEIGCGAADTGAYAKSSQKCGFYAGIELSPDAAAVARQSIDEVLVGDAERIDLPWPQESFDALVMSEVLEHLVDPWATLQRLRPLLKPGARVYASSPNVSHFRVILGQLRGRWDLTDTGIMDRTHLRWFTPKTFAEMFEGAGFEVHSVGPVAPFRAKAKIAMALTFGRTRHLFMTQSSIRATRR